LRWYENVGANKPFVKHEVSAGYAFEGIALADIDGDGKLDMALANPSQVAWVKNTDGKGRTWASPAKLHEITGGRCSVCTVHAADFDGDKKTDLLVVGEASDLLLLRNAGGGKMDLKTRTKASNGQGEHLRIADVTKDGLPDVILLSGCYGNDCKDLELLENVKGEAFAPTMLIKASTFANDMRAIDLGDYDNDGDLDVLLTRRSGVSWIENTGTTWSEQLVAKDQPYFRFSFAQDVGRDGDLDVVGEYKESKQMHFAFENKTTARLKADKRLATQTAAARK